MKPLGELDQYRDRAAELRAHGVAGGDHGGVFLVSHRGARLRIIASIGEGWDHVSVSMATRCPSWAEMSAVHRTFFLPDEAAFQLHVPEADHVNLHPHCLHLWRPQDQPVPRPPRWMVG